MGNVLIFFPSVLCTCLRPLTQYFVEAPLSEITFANLVEKVATSFAHLKVEILLFFFTK